MNVDITGREALDLIEAGEDVHTVDGVRFDETTISADGRSVVLIRHDDESHCGYREYAEYEVHRFDLTETVEVEWYE